MAVSEMRAKVVRVGNSRGIRLPASIIEQYQIEDAVELEPHEDHLVIRAVREPRAGWDEAFRRMAELGDDELLDQEVLTETKWERTEWEW